MTLPRTFIVALQGEYVTAMVEVFRCVRDVLADDGTLWLNIGDSYASHKGQSQGVDPKNGARRFGVRPNDKPMPGYKHKDLIGIPWMLAFALRADGWYLRQDIIWHKPNPMPESVRDRCTKAHEYIFLLSKSGRYYFDSEAMKEPAVYDGPQKSQKRGEFGGKGGAKKGLEPFRSVPLDGKRNRRSVWTIATRPYKGAHFATFPSALIEPCILAGSRPGDIVLDPFMGSGTTAEVAIMHGRQYAGCELNQDYKPLQDERIAKACAATARSVNKPCLPQKRPSLQFDLLDAGDGIDVKNGIVTPSCAHADSVPKIDAACD